MKSWKSQNRQSQLVIWKLQQSLGLSRDCPIKHLEQKGPAQLCKPASILDASSLPTCSKHCFEAPVQPE